MALGWLATLLLWWRSRSRSVGSAAVGSRASATERRPALRKLLRELDSACAVNDAGGARRLLLQVAEARFAPTPPRSLGALAAVLPDAFGREVLTLAAQIYGAVPGDWDGEGLRAVLAELAEIGKPPVPLHGEPLAPLYR
jgi:hypothetical protein